MVKIFGYDIAISDLICVILTLSLSLVYTVRTHGIKHILKEVEEFMNYKFKTIQDVQETKGQKFSAEKPVYRLNKATGELEKSEEVINIQEIVNSCLDTALNRVLDRLMPKVEQEQDIIELGCMRDDLDMAMELSEKAEYYRKKLGLGDNLGMNDIFNEVAKSAEVLKGKIDTYQAMKLKSEKERIIKNEESKDDEESK